MDYELERIWRIQKYGSVIRRFDVNKENKTQSDQLIEIIETIIEDKAGEIREEIVDEQINQICNETLNEIEIENILSKEFEENDRSIVKDVLDGIIKKIEGNEDLIPDELTYIDRIKMMVIEDVVDEQTEIKSNEKILSINKIKNKKGSIPLNSKLTGQTSKEKVTIINEIKNTEESISFNSESLTPSTNSNPSFYKSIPFFGITKVEPDRVAEKDDPIFQSWPIYDESVEIKERKISKNRSNRHSKLLCQNMIKFLRLSQLIFSISLIALSCFMLAIFPINAVYYLLGFSLMTFITILATNIAETKVKYHKIWIMINDIAVLIMMIVIIIKSFECYGKNQISHKNEHFQRFTVSLNLFERDISLTSLQESSQIIDSRVNENLLYITIICFVISIQTVVIWIFKLPIFN